MSSKDNLSAEPSAPLPEDKRRHYEHYTQESSGRRAFILRLQRAFEQTQDEAPMFAHPSSPQLPIGTLRTLFAEVVAAAKKHSDIATASEHAIRDYLPNFSFSEWLQERAANWQKSQPEIEALVQTALPNISIIGAHPKRFIALTLWNTLSKDQRAEITRLRGNMQAHMDDVGQLPQFTDGETFFRFMEGTIPPDNEFGLSQTRYNLVRR